MSFLDGILGAIGGFATGGPVGAAVGGIGGLTQSHAPQNRTNANAQQAQASQQQLQALAQLLQQRYQTASPQEQQVLNYFMQRAGLGAGATGGGYGQPSTIAPMGTASGLNGGQPFAAYGSRKTLPGFQQTQAAGTPMGGPGGVGLVNGSLGIWNSPEYALVRQKAEEDIGREMQDNQLSFNAQLADRGIDRSSVQQGGQAAITAGANKSYADFVRNLAISAADKQDSLVNQANSALQPSLNSAGLAGSLLGQAGGLGQSGQQLNQAQQNTNNSALGSAIGAASQYWALKGHGTPGGTNPGGVAGDTAAAGINDGGVLTAPLPQFAHGGYVQAGQPIEVGDGGGPEAFVPTSKSAESVKIPTAVLEHLMRHSNMAAGCYPARAHGGPVQMGQPTIVGEQGPEIMVPTQNGMILPNPATPPEQAPHPLYQYLDALSQFRGV